MLVRSVIKDLSLDSLECTKTHNKAFIYLANLSSWNENISGFWKYLSDQERKQAKQYVSEYLANQYIISHGILRTILSYHTNINPESIEFTHNEYGKPFLKDYDTIQFNMSHSQDFAGYIVALDNHVGIDIEHQNNSIDVSSLVDLVLTPSEYKLFNSLNADEKMKTFYDIWTKKEALVKANSTGLSYAINTIEVMNLDLDKGISLLDHKSKTKKEWCCFPLEGPLNYSGAMASEHKIHEVVYVDISRNSHTTDKVRTQCFH